MDLESRTVDLQQLLLLNPQPLRIPLYQRHYSWSSEECEQLWLDISDLGLPTRFFGTVILSEAPDGRLEIVDGQQRLSTLIMLLAAIRDQYSILRSDSDRRLDHLIRSSDASQPDRLMSRISLSRANEDAFLHYVIAPLGDARRREADEVLDARAGDGDPNRNLVRNADLLRAWVKEFVAPEETTSSEGTKRSRQEEALRALEERVLHDLMFVVIRVRDMAEDFSFYETINDRGMQLSAADLIKSQLLSRIPERRDEDVAIDLERRWSSAITSLRGADSDVFLRCYLLLRGEIVPPNRVFRGFMEFTRGKEIVDLVREVAEQAGLYSSLVHPEDVDHDAMREALAGIARLNQQSCYLALLPALQAFESDRSGFARFARLVQSMSFRWAVAMSQMEQDAHRRAHHMAHHAGVVDGAQRTPASAGSDDEVAPRDLEEVLREAGTILHERGREGIEAATNHLMHSLPDRQQFVEAAKTTLLDFDCC